MAARESDAVNAPSNFEVGVFCGTYVTPVDKAYFDHLEQIRGQSKKLKVEAEARRAVASGVAGLQQLQLAANGAIVNSNGQVVPAEAEDPALELQTTHHATDVNGDESPSVRTRMDISIHNMADVHTGY